MSFVLRVVAKIWKIRRATRARNIIEVNAKSALSAYAFSITNVRRIRRAAFAFVVVERGPNAIFDTIFCA
jgi:hypothetical protein